METRNIIQSSIDYIEEHLKTEITAQELSDYANFSLFHYYRLFQSAVGMPVMQYILRRKLLNAIYEISCGKKMIDVSLEYGLETYAGFYKAFKREFGYTPTQFLKKYRGNKPYKINLLSEECIVVTHKKIKEILKNWNLESALLTDFFYESSGVKSDNAFYVGNDYVIKFSANLGNMKTQIDISRALENVGLSAATPVKTTDGKEIIEDSQLYFFLTKRLKGRCIKAVDMYADDYKAKARFIGEIIGQLDLALNNVDVVVNDVNIYETVKGWAMPKIEKHLDLPIDVCNDYLDTFGLLYNKLPKQVIHRDPNPSNIIVADEEWGFIDFELSEKNVRIFDPCYAAVAILSESFDEKDNEKTAKWVEIYQNIIYGYDSVAKLSDNERKAVPYILLSDMFIGSAFFSGQEKYERLSEINDKMAKWCCNNFDKLAID